MTRTPYPFRTGSKLSTEVMELKRRAEAIMLALESINSDFIKYPGYDESYVYKALREQEKAVTKLSSKIKRILPKQHVDK